MSPKLSWAEKLKRYQKSKADDYARRILEEPQKVSLYSTLRFPGLCMIAGDIRTGKTGLAHEIASMMHSRRKLPATLHIPPDLEKRRAEIQKLVPPWMKVTSKRSEWVHGGVVIYDESAQTAHSRRAQSGDAVDLDNLLAIAGQRQQLILFISHYSRKLDLNVVTALHRIIWKRPTYAHQLWERNEITDFVSKAYDFFSGIKGEVAQKRACLVLNLDSFTFQQTTNRLPPWWGDNLSRLFEDGNKKTKRKGVSHEQDPGT